MSDQHKSGFKELAKEQASYPQEQLLKVKEGSKSLNMGIPCEISMQENRLMLTPEAIAVLTANGHEIIVEAGAGASSKFTDNEFSEAGAKIVYSAKEALEAHIILKVEPPTLDEIEMIKPGSILISALQLGNQTPEYIQALNKKKVTAIAFEFLEDKVGGMPVVRAMSEIAGNTVMSIAAHYLSSVANGKGMILGGITGVPPTKVVILGAGTVGEYAARSAIGLGAQVQVFDHQIYKLRRIKHALGHQVYTSTMDISTLGEALENADVVIGAVRAEKGTNRMIVTEEMVANMKEESVIIDVSIDQGGCIETSKLTSLKNPVFRKYNVIHYCVPNIASRVARTATTAFSNIFTPILLQTADLGGVNEMIYHYRWFMRGVYTYNGSLTNAAIGKKFNMKFRDLNLLMAARF
ncbi:alanine dehydrogenase [Catalinimonas niigatensis]|uniref:alanine dehydrogenase n=1 Tax=Catalinimonas niigatensis TaxID=1397264 RepID=UPI0026670743|nr:alanine dehydrogenase [Catalinimonas niigatensis]WPP48518.1 alanine dehydrogenase [Catalinimonas niigatensis]